MHRKENMINIGATIKKYRDKREITQSQLAKKINVTPTYISALENNRKDPSLSLLTEISRELEIPLEVMFWDTIEVKNIRGKDKEILEVAKGIINSYYKSE